MESKPLSWQPGTRADRQRGALIGLAVGDALGAAVEFQRPGTFVPVTDYRAGGPHGLDPGEWTDDTSLALALADSLGTVGWDVSDQARRYLAWLNSGRYSVNGRVFDVGITTRAALRRFETTGDAISSGDTSASASGNGSIMRLAPVAIAYGAMLWDDRETFVARLAQSSLPTHASHACVSGCVVLGVMLAGLIEGQTREAVFAPDWEPLRWLLDRGDLHPEIADIAGGRYRTPRPPTIRGSGYVVESLEAALWAVHDAADFREAVLRAVNLGDDADTTGAVCGQIAGAIFGESGIPETWRANLARHDLIETVLIRILHDPS